MINRRCVFSKGETTLCMRMKYLSTKLCVINKLILQTQYLFQLYGNDFSFLNTNIKKNAEQCQSQIVPTLFWPPLFSVFKRECKNFCVTFNASFLTRSNTLEASKESQGKRVFSFYDSLKYDRIYLISLRKVTRTKSF